MVLREENDFPKIKSVLYIISLYGGIFHKMCIKYLRENNYAKVTIIELPTVRLSKRRLCIDAFISNEDEEKIQSKIDIFFPLPQFFTFVIQYVLNFYLLFKLLKKAKRRQFDICIGEANYNGVMAFLLKRIGKCKFSVFMNGDILPETSSRSLTYLQMDHYWITFFNKYLEIILIKIQYILRRIAYKNDLIWYPSGKIKEWDTKKKFNAKKSFTASSPVDYKIIRKNSGKQKLSTTLCYIGGLYESSGLNIMISSIKIVKEIIKDIKVLVIGGSIISVEKYKKIATSCGVEKYISFYGYMPEKDAEDILSSSIMGLALYEPVESNVSIYTDVSKVKTYINAGLPVIITRNGPEIWEDIEKFNAGVIVNYNETDIAENIINILTNPNMYNVLKDGILKFGEANDYEKRCRYVWDCIVTEFCEKTGNLVEGTKKI